jgi:hypothetical protein
VNQNTAIIIDGALYAAVAVFAFLQSQIGGDDAANLFSQIHLWWAKVVIGSFAAGTLAVKLYRSTAFADNQKRKDDTAFMNRNQPKQFPHHD